MGTPLFMAPEQFRDPSAVDERADVFSLGVMLFFLLTGVYPYDGEDPMQVMHGQVSVLSGAPTPRPSDHAPVTPQLEGLCLDALQLDPEARLPSATAFLALLRPHLAPEKTPPPRRNPSPPRPQRHPRSTGSIPRVVEASQEPPTISAYTQADEDSESLWGRLGLDDDGFAPRVSLRRLALLEDLPKLLAGVAGLWVHDERPLEGKQTYEDTIGFLLRRDTGRTADSITLGRSTQTDLAVRLITISTLHLEFQREGPQWFVRDRGSSNGTHHQGRKLEAGERVALSSGDDLRLADHLTLRFFTPADLANWLSE